MSSFDLCTLATGDVQDSEVQLAMSQLFASPMCEKLLADIVRERCSARLTIARDVLLLVCLLQHQGKGQVKICIYNIC